MQQKMNLLTANRLDAIASEAVYNCAMQFGRDDVIDKMRADIGTLSQQELIQNAPILVDDAIHKAASRAIAKARKLRAMSSSGVRDFMAWDAQVIALGEDRDGKHHYIHRRDATLQHLEIHQAQVRRNLARVQEAMRRDLEDEQPVIEYMVTHQVNTWGEACRQLGLYGALAA